MAASHRFVSTVCCQDEVKVLCITATVNCYQEGISDDRRRQMSFNFPAVLFCTYSNSVLLSVLFSPGTMQTSVRPSRPVTRRWTPLWQSSLVYVTPSFFPHFAKITFEHINDFRTRTFPSGWVPNKLDMEFVIKYEWQPMQFLTASTPWRLFTPLFLSFQTELYCWGQLPCGFTWAVQVHQQILWSSEYEERTKTRWLGLTGWWAVVQIHLKCTYKC